MPEMPDNPKSLWPGEDDTEAIEAMLNKHHPLYDYHWQRCQIFVGEFVKKRANGFSEDQKEEITQNVMVNIVRSLHDFRRKSRLTTWITKIVINCTVNAGREQQALLKHVALPDTDPDDNQQEDYTSKIRTPRTTEEECILREDLREAYNKLIKHLSTRLNKERAFRIFELHQEGLSQKEIAEILGIPAPNVGYAIRAKRKFLHEQQQ